MQCVRHVAVVRRLSARPTDEEDTFSNPTQSPLLPSLPSPRVTLDLHADVQESQSFVRGEEEGGLLCVVVA